MPRTQAKCLRSLPAILSLGGNWGWGKGEAGNLTLVYVWGQLLVELLHYPVAMVANCNFPPVLGVGDGDHNSAPSGASGKCQAPQMGPSIPGLPGTLSAALPQSLKSIRWSDWAAVSCLIFSLIPLEEYVQTGLIMWANITQLTLNVLWDWQEVYLLYLLNERLCVGARTHAHTHTCTTHTSHTHTSILWDGQRRLLLIRESQTWFKQLWLFQIWRQLALQEHWWLI